MGTHLLSATGRRALALMLLSCLALLLIPNPTHAQAGNPAFENPVCTVQSVGNPIKVWQIKGTGQVKNLPQKTMSVAVKIKFQKKPNGGMAFTTFLEVNQSTTPLANGTASFDTGFQTLTPNPAKGDQYLITVDGSYTTPDGTTKLTGVLSLPVTPIP